MLTLQPQPTKITSSSAESRETIFIHIPPHKVKLVQTTTFVWVYFPQINRQILTLKTLP